LKRIIFKNIFGKEFPEKKIFGDTLKISNFKIFDQHTHAIILRPKYL
jgi:hypothetical protein